MQPFNNKRLNTIKKFKFTTSEEFEYNGSLISIMQEDMSWYSIMDHAKKVFGDNELYVVVSETAGYWKTDGQIYTATVYGTNTKK